ncbi:hypothetical protein niasHT_013399 [Heterodera trifolii]|uniref:Secreted protein n=1 Tax=Heterodera trifolii TaxID=157864 RepID=A0ABD2LDB3_9BILA
MNRSMPIISMIILLLVFLPTTASSESRKVSAEDAKINIDGPLCWVSRKTGQVFEGIVCPSTIPTETSPTASSSSTTTTKK